MQCREHRQHGGYKNESIPGRTQVVSSRKSNDALGILRGGSRNALITCDANCRDDK